MANLTEDEVWEDGIYQIEVTDPVVGGPPNLATGAGISNVPHQQLAKRTSWLKQQLLAMQAALGAASTAVAGIVRLSTSTSSTSTTMAATPSAVKAVKDAVDQRALASTQITGAGLATGGGDLSDNRSITVTVASQAEAVEGLVNDKAMTPLRVAQSIGARTASIGKQIFVLDERQASGVASAVALVAGTWVKRSIVQRHNAIFGASVAAGVMTIPAGTYSAHAVAKTGKQPGGAWRRTVIRLRDTSNNASLIVGMAGESFDADFELGFGRTELHGVFTLVSPATVELQQWVSADLGGGEPVNSGEAEVYASLVLNKVA